MKFKMKGKPSSFKSAVSDIIGNLLILAITVVLFSSVLYSVMNLPGPQNQTYAEFSYEQPIYYGADGVGIYALLNITMGGGQTLVNEDIVVVVLVNDAPVRRTLLDGGVGPEWVTGETWSNKTYLSEPTDQLDITIIDNTNNNVVWQSTLVTGGITQDYAPIITERGIVQYPIYDGTDLTFYCKVVDFNSNLNINSVYVNLGGLGVNQLFKLTYDPGTGTFRSSVGVIDADLGWNGKTIEFNATDLTDLEGTATSVVTVFKDDVGSGGGGNPGSPPGNIDYSGLQGFNIFELNDWLENSYDATPMRTFHKNGVMSQSVVIVVVSKYLVNTETENNIQVMNTTTKMPYVAVSTPNVVFESFEFVSGYYVYTATFNTTLLPNQSSYYYIKANIKDNWVPNNQFVMNDMIFVTIPWGSQSPTYPVMLTYSNSAYTIATSDFTTYNPTNNIIYVELLNYFGDDWDPYTGDVEIRDFFWNAQLKKSPDVGTDVPMSSWNGPISNLWQIAQTAPPGKYRFAINLGNVTDGASWIPGKNAYALRYDMFKAGSEKNLMSKIINITAPTIKLDIAVGSQTTSSARWATANALYYYANENQWYPPRLMETGSTDKKTYSPNVKFVRAADINGDNRTDLVSILQDDKTPGTNPIYLNIYYNFKSVTGENSWLKTTITTLPTTNAADIKDVAIGNIDYDNDADIAIGYLNRIDIYRNDGAWTKTSLVLTNVNKVLMADMDPAGTAGNDPYRAHDIIVGRIGGLLTIMKNRFGNGVTWDENTLSATGTAPIDYWASGEYNVTGTVTNNYLYTNSPSQDDGVYEQIIENITWRYAQVFPQLKGSNDTVSDTLPQLEESGDIIPVENAFTVNDGYIAHVKTWDSTGLSDDLVPFKVTLKVKYMTDPTYGTTGDYMVWHRIGGDINTIQMENTNGVWVEREIDITAFAGPAASQLSNLDLELRNTNGLGAAINFDYWWINVTWKTGDSLEHIWEFTLNPAQSGNHLFNVYALRSASLDGDNFVFSYSTSLSGPWTQITSATIGTTIPMQAYTGTIPGTVQGTVYIKVDDTSLALTANPILDYLRIGQMRIITTVQSTTVGSNILALNIADMDQDGDTDLIVVGQKPGNTGQVYVLYNGPGDIFLPANVRACGPTSALLYTSISINAGKYFDPYGKSYLDISIGTTTKLYFIKQTSAGVYGAALSALQMTNSYGNFKKVIGVDVDGNNRGDLVAITTTGNIVIYANYMGLESPVGWQIYIVDSLGAGVNDMDVSKFA